MNHIIPDSGSIQIRLVSGLRESGIRSPEVLIVFDILGPNENERGEVYGSLCEQVVNRLDKARSV